MADRDYWRRPYRCFVSYAHKDKEIVHSIVAFLERLDGGAVWFDETPMDTGDPSAAEIRGRLLCPGGADR